MTNQLIKFFNITGLTWFVPLVKIAAGENPTQQVKQLWLIMGVPIIAFIIFLGLWSASATQIHTSLGAIPGPSAVWHEVGSLVADHKEERLKEVAFNERQEARNVKKLAKNPDAEIYYLRGATYFEIKDKSKACADLKKAKEMGHKKAAEVHGNFCY